MPKKKRNHVEKGTWSLGAIDRLLAFSVYSYVYARIPISPFFFTVLTLSNNRCSIGNFSQLTSILPIFHWSCIYFWKKKRNHPRELSWGAAESGGPWAAAMRRLARWTRDKASNSVCETRKWTLTRPWTPSTIPESGIVLPIFLICCL